MWEIHQLFLAIKRTHRYRLHRFIYSSSFAHSFFGFFGLTVCTRLQIYCLHLFHGWEIPFVFLPFTGPNTRVNALCMPVVYLGKHGGAVDFSYIYPIQHIVNIKLIVSYVSEWASVWQCLCICFFQSLFFTSHIEMAEFNVLQTKEHNHFCQSIWWQILIKRFHCGIEFNSIEHQITKTMHFPNQWHW